MTTLHQFTVSSAEELPRELAPADYLPTLDPGPMVYDDELDTLPGDMAWRTFFAGGSNRLHWVRSDADGNPYLVEQVGMGGPYEVGGMGEWSIYDNAYDAFWWADQRCQVPADGYTMAGITDGSDSFPCLKCSATVYPWFTRCEGCGDLHPAQPKASATWTCSECGTDDHETQEGAERCCSMFYCHDCGYGRADLREACHCPPTCHGCDKEVTVTETECSADNWKLTLHLSDAEYPVAIYSAEYGGTYCRDCYIAKGGEWEESE